MSTRANIVVTDEYGEKLFFYRHSDGYPEGAMPMLEKFIGLVKEGSIRDNIGQASGWLILLGAKDYGSSLETINKNKMNGWKVGAIEPTMGLHGDIQYLYVINLSTKKIVHKQGFDLSEKDLTNLIKESEKV